MDKVWVAKDVKIGNQVRIISHDSKETGQHIITIIRDYRYQDSNGKEIPELVVKRVAKDYTWENLPQDIRSLLIKLDKFTKAEALKDAGME